jgi:hypothetical protein
MSEPGDILFHIGSSHSFEKLLIRSDQPCTMDSDRADVHGFVNGHPMGDPHLQRDLNMHLTAYAFGGIISL